MKSYPSIPRTIRKDGPFYVFDKLDGSNIRAEWSRKKGFCKFGTRKRLLDATDPLLGSAVQLIQDKYGEALGAIGKAQRWEKAVFFFEFFGPSSFAGWHDPEEEKDVVLFDVSVHKKGMLGPKQFLKLFSELHIAEFLYHGNINETFIRSVRESTLEGMTFEGVIIKGVPDKQGPGMFKIKSEAWLEALKSKCKDEEEFERLQ